MLKSNKAWYIVYIGDSRRIKYLNQAFDSLNVEHTLWIPERKVLDRKGRTRRKSVNVSNVEEKTKPLFPGYVFVNFYYHDSLGIGEGINFHTGGRLLRSPGSKSPYVLSDDYVKSIKQLEVSKEEAQFLATKYKINLNDQVELLDGAFKGFRGSVIGLKRSTVLVEISILNRSVTLEVDPSNCIKDE